MAAVNGARTVHATLSTTVVDTVTLGAHRINEISIYNRETSGANLTVTIGGASAGGPPTPVALAHDTYLIAPGASINVQVPPEDGAQTVKILGSGNAYSVTAVGLDIPVRVKR